MIWDLRILGRRGCANGVEGARRRNLVVAAHLRHRLVQAEEVDVFAAQHRHLDQGLADRIQELSQAAQEACVAHVVRGLELRNALGRGAQS